MRACICKRKKSMFYKRNKRLDTIIYKRTFVPGKCLGIGNSNCGDGAYCDSSSGAIITKAHT